MEETTLSLEIECPDCHFRNCVKSYDVEECDEQTVCTHCGYMQFISYKKDENGEPIRRDESKGIEEENLIIQERVHEKQYGCFIIVLDSVFGPQTLTFGVPDEERYRLMAATLLTQDGVTSIQFNRVVEGQLQERKLK
jgi:hypothetical protein